MFGFALLILSVELNIYKSRYYFYFLNFAWGKASFNLLIASLCLSSGLSVHWVDILIGAYFALLVIPYFIISCVYSLKENEYVKSKLIDINSFTKELGLGVKKTPLSHEN